MKKWTQSIQMELLELFDNNSRDDSDDDNDYKEVVTNYRNSGDKRIEQEHVEEPMSREHEEKCNECDEKFTKRESLELHMSQEHEQHIELHDKVIKIKKAMNKLREKAKTHKLHPKAVEQVKKLKKEVENY